MVLPPTPEGSAFGLPGGDPPWGMDPPSGGQGRRGRRNAPAIGVDPNTIGVLGRVREAIRGLRAEMKGLADEGERWMKSMGRKAQGWASGGRPAGMPEVRSLESRLREEHNLGRGPVGGGVEEGRFSRREENLYLATQLGPRIVQAITAQLGSLAQRESITTRMGMLMPGQYNRGGPFAAGTGRDVQQMLRRESFGYTSTGELYQGGARLQEVGLLRGRADRDRELLRQTSLAGRVTGGGFGSGAEAMAAFRAPQTVQTLMHQFGITSPFQGGNMQMFGQQGVLEQMTQMMTRGLGGPGGGQAEQFWQGAMTPGSPAYLLMQSMGMDPEQMKLLQQYGAARAEGVGADDTEALKKRFKDTGENLKDLREAFTELMDVVSTGLIPIVKGLSNVLKPLADGFAWLNDKIPGLEEAVGVVVTALMLWAAKVRAQAFLSDIGGLGGLRGGAGKAAGGKGGMIAGGLARGGAMLGGLTAGGTLLATGGMALGGYGGSKLGRHVGGEGWKGKAGSVLGGAAAGAATGALLGTLGGPLAPLTSSVGAVAGGVIGGVMGLFGDAWPPEEREGIGDGEAKAPTAGIANGMDLPGAKAGDQNMNPEFVKRLAQMFADNPALTLTSGWRDSAEQARLYREKPHLAAPPGKSNHERGTAADLGPESQWPWIRANVGKYGLFLPMPPTAERRAKGKKIEPWHVEPVGLTGAVPAQAASDSGGGSAWEAAVASKNGKAKAKPKSPETSSRGGGGLAGGSPGYQAASTIAARTGGSQIGDAWEGMGDNEVYYYGTQPSSGGRSAGGSIHVGKIEINLTIARGTPEEAERTARYLGELLGDRDRLLALANGTGG